MFRLLFILLLTPAGLYAQHSIVVSGGPSVTGIKPSYYHSDPEPRMGFGIGLGYQRQYKWLLIEHSLDYSRKGFRETEVYTGLYANTFHTLYTFDYFGYVFRIGALYGKKRLFGYTLLSANPAVMTVNRAEWRQFWNDTGEWYEGSGKVSDATPKRDLSLGAETAIGVHLGSRSSIVAILGFSQGIRETAMSETQLNQGGWYNVAFSSRFSYRFTLGPGSADPARRSAAPAPPAP